MWKVQFILFLSFIQTFFWSENCTILVCKLYLLCQTILDLLPVLTVEGFISEILRRVSFSPYLLLLMFFLVCKSGTYIITFWHFNQALPYSKGFLVFSFIVFRDYENLKSNRHLLFLAIFSALERKQFCSVNYVCQVCKL